MKIEDRPKKLSEAEVRAILDIGVEEQVLMKEEREMMKDVLEFHDTAIRAIMTPRNSMFVLSGRLLIWDALPLINESGYSRIPIVEENNKDNVTGVVHTRDVLRAVEGKTSYMMLKDIARRPIFVSKDMAISKLLREFQSHHQQLAIVVDEFGSTEGLVTLEDVIEELVGEIADETDTERQLLRRIDRQTVVIQGDIEIDDINDALNTHVPKTKDYSTISGLLHEQLKRIPRQGDTTTIGNVTIRVEETAKNVPLKIIVTKAIHEDAKEEKK
jgi:CBS domain containing-hemolysin-like protein